MKLSKLSLQDINKGGMQGTIKRVNKNYVVKLLHTPQKTNEEKIKKMCEVQQLKNEKNICWPLDCLYDDNETFRGYLMRSAPTAAQPFTTLFNSKSYELLGTTNTVTVAQNLIRVVGKLHQNGILLCDFNPNNFMLDMNTYEVYAIDTDNFQFETYNGEQYKRDVACSLYLDSKIQLDIERLKKRGIKSEEIITKLPYGIFTYKTDMFSLMILVFQVLMNGVHPYTGMFDGKNIIEQKNIIESYMPYFGTGKKTDLGHNRPPIQVLNNELYLMFYQAFLKDRTYSENELLEALARYKNQLTERCIHEHYIQKDLKACCPWCKINATKNRTTKKKDDIQLIMTPKPKITEPPSKMSMSTNHKYVDQHQQNALEKEKKKRIALTMIFLIVAAIEIAFFVKGQLAEYYNVFTGGQEILEGTAKYLMLFAGLAAALLVSFFYDAFDNLSPGFTIALDLATQAGIYYLLLDLIGAFVTIASYLLIGLISIAVIALFMKSL